MYPAIAPHWELYETHLDEAEFLAGQWERALVAPDRRWPDVAQREARLLAHVDALVLGERPVAQRLLLPTLGSDEVARVTPAALALLEDGSGSSRHAVLDAFLEGPPEPRPGLRRALELCEREEFLSALTAPLLSEDTAPDVLAAALEVHTARGRCPDVPLEDLLSSPEPQVVAAACGAVMTVSAPPAGAVLHWLGEAMRSPVLRVRDAALAAGAVLGLRAAWARCRSMVEARGRTSPGRLPLLLLAMGGAAPEQELLRSFLREPRLRADVAWALGYTGRPAAAEACLELLEDSDACVVRLATESFSAITGFPLEDGHLREDEEETEDDGEAGGEVLLEAEVEKALPQAEPTAARTWWGRERRRFAPDVRYLGGTPFDTASLALVFGTAPARRWPALALELAIRSRGQYLLSPRAFSPRRRQQLAQVAGFPSRAQQPFSTLLDQ